MFFLGLNSKTTRTRDLIGHDARSSECGHMGRDHIINHMAKIIGRRSITKGPSRRLQEGHSQSHEGRLLTFARS